MKLFLWHFLGSSEKNLAYKHLRLFESFFSKLLVLRFSLFESFWGCFGSRRAWEIDQHLSEYHRFDAPEAHLCSSSGSLGIANPAATLSLSLFLFLGGMGWLPFLTWTSTNYRRLVSVLGAPGREAIKKKGFGVAEPPSTLRAACKLKLQNAKNCSNFKVYRPQNLVQGV